MISCNGCVKKKSNDFSNSGEFNPKSFVIDLTMNKSNIFLRLFSPVFIRVKRNHVVVIEDFCCYLYAAIG